MSQQPPANLPNKPPGEWEIDGQGTSESAPESRTPLVESFQKAVPPQDVKFVPGVTYPVYVKDIGRGRLEWATESGETLNFDGPSIAIQTTTSDEARPAQFSGSYDDLAKDFANVEYRSVVDDMSPDVKYRMQVAALKVQSLHGVRKLQRIIKPYQHSDSRWVSLSHVPTENHKALLRTLTEATMIVPSDVNRLNELIARISQSLGSETKPLVDMLIAAGDNLLSEHAQETDHFVIAIREYQAAIRELLK